jgi:predicted lipoprotein
VTTSSATSKRVGLSPRVKRWIWIGAVVVLLVLMVLDTKVVSLSSSQGAPVGAFSATNWASDNFPKIQSDIDKRAVDAKTLAAALKANSNAATKKYGVPGGTGPEFSVKFTGVAGKPTSGIYPVKVSGVPGNLLIRVQTGPAINGTDLRDATGKVTFGQFTNQIDYQNAGAALNKEMKKQVLAKVDAAHLTGKTLTVVGAFQLINPQAWLVTPSKLSVQ